MKTKQIKHIIIAALITIIASCEGTNYHDKSRTVIPPSPGAPSGNDALSSSTNFSGKENVTTPKLSAYAGAAFVKPPSINNYGSVSFSYAMVTPQGRAGMQPSIGISYSSSGGDGLAGIGWNLSTGLGVISRTTKNGQLYYDHRDTFTFNGKRLVKVSGPTGSEEGTYRLEIESGFSRLELSDVSSGGIWKVYDKAGTVTIFGKDKTSRIYKPENENKTYIWNFTRSEDLNGNYMYAVYDTSSYSEDRVLYLKEIHYTGNVNTSYAPKQKVVLKYDKRAEAYVSKGPGFIMKMDRILESVEMYYDDDRLWYYEMEYKISEDSNRPVLQNVKSSRNTTEPKFHYQEAKHLFVWKKVHNPDSGDHESNPDTTRYFEGDFNGDGISDMVFFNPITGKWKAAEARRDGGYNFKTYGQAFGGRDGAQKIQFFKGNVTGDYNGDGKSDIAFYLPDTKEFWVAEHNGKIFTFVNYGRNIISDIDIFKCEWFPGDYDGNGLSDTILYHEATGEWIMMRNIGGSFVFKKFGKKFQNLFRNDYSPNDNRDSVSTRDHSTYGLDRGKVHFLNGDYNGDGRTDFSIYDARSGNWFVGTTHREENYDVASFANGIGLDQNEDFRIEWTLYKKFTAPEKSLFGHDRFSGDFNGDGYSDFLLFDRSKGEWILGAVKDSTIDFQVFSKAPEFKDITRWLQGDFNGDGRTDIGFFSKTDNNFWIGEATPNGFRYRIYNNLSYGPGTKVLQAPEPKAEVKITTKTTVSSFQLTSTDPVKTTAFTYEFNGNYKDDGGELVYTGNFDGNFNGATQQIIYDKYKQRLFFKRGNGTLEDYNLSVDLTKSSVKVIGKRVFEGKEALIYYEFDSSIVGADDHYFYAIIHNGTKLEKIELAKVVSSDFVYGKSLWALGRFIKGSDNYHIAVLKDKMSVPELTIYKQGTSDSYIIKDDASDSLNLQNISAKASSITMMAGNFTSTGHNQIAIADASSGTWYVLTLPDNLVSSQTIDFKQLFGVARYNPALATGIERISDNALLRVVREGSQYKVEKYSFDSSNNVSVFRYAPLEENITPLGFTPGEELIVKTTSGFKKYELLSSSYNISEFTNGGTNSITTIKRPDLIENKYKFRWIQGDYNGDGKTDIGIFHLKESTWYYAMTQGTVPDLISKVDNGLGGTYKFEYKNSTSFDNTGDDDIPDLPMNYKVCVSLAVDDGRGHEVITKYNYSGGYAFSSFINGKKETDYFGFSTFETEDAYGSKTINTYYTTPFSDYRKNRVLAGAMKESVFKGSDNLKYSKTTYEYRLHEISSGEGTSNISLLLDDFGNTVVTGSNIILANKNRSYLIEPVKVKKYSFKKVGSKQKEVLTQTTTSNIVLTSGSYAMESKSESVTDHYVDAIHNVVTLTSTSEFENIESSNEMRLKKKITLNDTSHETTVEYTYDAKGNVESEHVYYSGTGLPSAGDSIKRYEYDNYGNRIKDINASGTPKRIVEKEYDDKLHQFVVKETAKGPRDLTTLYDINYGIAFGGINIKTEPTGSRTYFEYDKFARLENQKTDTDSGVQLLNDYSYDSRNDGVNPLSARVNQHDGRGKTIATRIYADGVGRIIHTVRSTGNDVAGKRYVKSGMVKYDAVGRVIRKSQPAWAMDHEIDRFVPLSQEKHPTLTDYDASGRPLRVTMPKAFAGEKTTSVTYTYNDPYETIETHSIGRVKRTVKNGRGQVLYVSQSGVGDDGTTVASAIGFAYNLAGKRILKFKVQGSGLGVTGFVNMMSQYDSRKSDPSSKPGIVEAETNYWWYDGLGRVRGSYDADKGFSSSTYNSFGQVKTVTDSRGLTTSLVYDTLGRVIQKNRPGSEGTVKYTYDVGGSNAMGKVTKIEDSSQIKYFDYDVIGRVKKERRYMRIQEETDGLSDEYVTEFKHDLLGRKYEILYPEDPRDNVSLKVTYYHSANGVERVVSNRGSVEQEIISSINYNEFGEMTQVVRGNGTITNYEYDNKGRLTHLVTTTPDGNTRRTLQQVTYDFKIDNSIKSRLTTSDYGTSGYEARSVKHDYVYDGLNRLIRAYGNLTNGGQTQKYSRGYGYSDTGNMTHKTVYNVTDQSIEDKWNYYYGNNNHAVTRIDSSKTATTRFSLVYDTAGNMITRNDLSKSDVKNMEYDSENRIKEVTDGSGNFIGKYWYDDQGFRVRKLAKRVVDGEERRLEVLYPSMYFGIEQQRRISDGYAVPNTQSAVSNIYVNGVRFAAISSGNKTRYYHTDQVDSVSFVTDEVGSAVHRFEYLPYGEAWKKEKNTKVGEEDHNPKFNSQELDTETNFYYYNARYYDPEISRFVTADPVVDGVHSLQGWNGYMYVQGNPIVYKDPTGNNNEGLDADTINSPEYQGGTDGFVFDMVNSVTDTVNIALPKKYEIPKLKPLSKDERYLKAYKYGESISTVTQLANLGKAGYSGAKKLWKNKTKIVDGVKDLYNKGKNLLKKSGKNTSSAVSTVKKVSNRLKYMGRTPGKKSRTGKEVIAKMRADGKVKGYGKKMIFQDSKGNWHNIKDADMAHKVDCVKWWNKTGRKFGAKSKEVRKWMLDSKNYYLEHYKINRSQGAKLRIKYKDPNK